MFKNIFNFFAFAACVSVLLVLCGPASAGDVSDPTGYNGVGGMALLINAGSLRGLFTNLNAIFNKAFQGAESDWEETAMRIPSTAAEEDYAWLASVFPKLRKWVGDKVIKSHELLTFSLKNEPFEATVAVKRDHIKDDKIGIYTIQTQSAGVSARTWPDELISEVKNAAFATICFDGQYFYDTDHPVGGATVSNKLTVALSCASKSAAKASYGAARTAMRKFTDVEGRKLGLKPNILEVPPALEEVALTLCNEDKLDDNSPNPYKGMAKVKVNDRLDSDTAWFLHCTTQPVKPFIFQEREAPEFVSQTNMESDDVFNRAEYKFGVEARGNAGVGLWMLSVGSTGAA